MDLDSAFFLMSIDLQQLINSPFAVRFLSLVARGIPPRLGYSLCSRIGTWVATRRTSKLTEIIRANQWVVRGANLENKALGKAVQETLQNNTRDLYNLYHYLHRPAVMQQMVRLSPQTREIVQRPEFAERGLIILGLHLSNFDFVLRCMSQQGFKPMILTISDPQGGRRVEYEMRKSSGMNLVPSSADALRLAVRHLEEGGMVLTGADRPVADSRYQPKFFGRPASLPVHHIFLANKSHVPIVVMAVIQQADGQYYVHSSEYIAMEPDSDHGQEILQNAERVLKEAENFIRLAPQQWNMPLPVWPQYVEKR
jgi:phosphatidylinositol dimannoside acyltransferase